MYVVVGSSRKRKARATFGLYVHVVDLADNGNLWAQRGAKSIGAADIVGEFSGFAKIASNVWAKVLDLSAGEQEILAWECMSTEQARSLHLDVWRAICDGSPDWS